MRIMPDAFHTVGATIDVGECITADEGYPNIVSLTALLKQRKQPWPTLNVRVTQTGIQKGVHSMICESLIESLSWLPI